MLNKLSLLLNLIKDTLMNSFLKNSLIILLTSSMLFSQDKYDEDKYVDIFVKEYKSATFKQNIAEPLVYGGMVLMFLTFPNDASDWSEFRIFGQLIAGAAPGLYLLFEPLTRLKRLKDSKKTDDIETLVRIEALETALNEDRRCGKKCARNKVGIILAIAGQ